MKIDANKFIYNIHDKIDTLLKSVSICSSQFIPFIFFFYYNNKYLNVKI